MTQEKSIIDYFKEVLTENYANFNGRARRKEYWGFTLINFIISMVITGILGAISIDLINFGYIYSLAVFIPGLAVSVRRLHDIGKSGWWLLIAFIPLIGAILLIVWMCTDSDAGANEYGPNPKNPDNEIASLGTE